MSADKKTENHLSPDDVRKTLNKIHMSPSSEQLESLGMKVRTKLPDLGKMTTPEEIAETFGKVYTHEWQQASESLLKKWSNDEVVYFLFRILRTGYEYCLQVAEKQLQTLQSNMETVMLNPTGTPSSTADKNPSLKHGEHYICEYRKATASASQSSVQERFMVDVLPTIFDLDFLTEDVQHYIQKAIALLWMMCVQTPPMTIYWQPKGDTLCSDYFHSSSKKGKVVDWTVWPAVFLKKDGHLLLKGTVQPI